MAQSVTAPKYQRCDDCGRNQHKIAARVGGRVHGYCPSCWESVDRTGADVIYDRRRIPADAHGLFARTARGTWRIGGWSSWDSVQRRFNAATANGRHTECTVYAYIDGRWQDVPGHLAVRSAGDPVWRHAAVANRRTGLSATIRAADFRKVR